MIHLRAIVVVIVLLALLAIPISKYWAFLTRGMSPPASSYMIDQMEATGIPDFTLPDRTGTPVNFKSIIGNRLIVVNFWASWCAPCVKEFPSLKRLAEKFSDKLLIVAVSNDYEKADLESFLASFGDVPKNFVVLWDKDKKVADLYGTQVLPESYIAKPDLKLIRKVAGVDEWDSAGAIEFFQRLVAAP